MISKSVLLFLWFGIVWQASFVVAADFQMSAQKGLHRFPFFEKDTQVWTYNNQIPGPVLRGKEGSVLVVDLVNNLDEPTSIHWHGLRIENAMDGVPGVTQDPIAPGQHFKYRLDLRDAGTFWYHPHFNAGKQIEMGLKGVIIVEDREPLPWSQDVVWLIDDWLFQNDGTIYPHFNTPPDLMHDGRWGNAITINDQVKPELKVNPGERIRLRLINGSNARIFSQTLEGLPAKVIAVDGRPVSSVFPYENFILAPGNRVDLDITIPESAAGKTFLLEDQFTRRKFTLGSITVSKAPIVPTPQITPVTLPDYIPAQLFDKVEVTKTWDLNAIRGGKFGIGWSMNNQLWPEADKASFKAGTPVKIRFQNSSSRLHPMHLHGTFFRVLSVDGNPTIEPFTRDTVLVGPQQTIVIGLVPDNHGIWLTHCHIQAHAEAGMMTTITVE